MTLMKADADAFRAQLEEAVEDAVATESTHKARIGALESEIEEERAKSAKAAEEAAAARAELAASVVEFETIRDEFEGEKKLILDAADATKRASKLAAKRVADDAEALRVELLGVRRAADAEAAANRNALESLRRQIKRLENDAVESERAAIDHLGAVKRDLASARADAREAERARAESERRTRDAEARAADAESRAAAAEASERKLMAMQKKANALAREREGKEAEAAREAARAARAEKLAASAASASASSASSSAANQNAPPATAAAAAKKKSPTASKAAKARPTDPALQAARDAAVKDAAAEVERERVAAAKALADAKRARRKAIEAEEISAARLGALAPPHLKTLKLASRAFVVASDGDGDGEADGGFDARDALVEMLGARHDIATTTRPNGVDAAPARAGAAAAVVVLATSAARADERARREITAALTHDPPRRVILLVARGDDRGLSGLVPEDVLRDASVEDGAVEIIPCEMRGFVAAATRDADAAGFAADADAAVAAVARCLGAPDAFLASLPASSLASIASARDAPLDLSGLGALTTLTAPAGDGDALRRVLSAPSCRLRALTATRAPSGAVAGAIAASAMECASLRTLSFGGATLPIAEARAGKLGLGGWDGRLDLSGTTDRPSSEAATATATEEPRVAECELCALRAMFAPERGGCGGAVREVTLHAKASAATTRAVVAAIRGASDSDPDATTPHPSVNGVPAVLSPDSDDVVDLSGMACGAPGLVALAVALETGPTGTETRAASLSTLSLGGSSLGGADAGAALAAALASPACAKLRRLLLPGAALGPSGVRAVCDALPPSLETLDLGSNAAGDDAGAAAATALRRCAALATLSVAANEIGPEGAKALAPAIRDHASLRELHLNGNRVGDKGVTSLCVAIKTTKAPFARLILSENFNVTAGGMKPLASLVSTSRTLTELNLSRVMIGAEGAKALCVGLRDPACALKVLELGACKLRADGAKHLGDAIRANASILRLGLSRNSLGDKGVFELVAGGLESAKSLVELYVRDNAIGPEGAKRLTTALRTKNFTLRALAFYGNKLDDVKTAALVALAMSTTRGVRLKPQVVAAGNAEEKSANPVTSKEAEGDENKLPETAAAAATKPPSPARQIATSSEEDFIEEDLPEEIDD